MNTFASHSMMESAPALYAPALSPEVAEGGRKFDIVVPLSKAIPTSSGGYDIRGIATDERRDVDREIVKAARAPWTLDYLREAGCFNWNHTLDIIGPVTGADWLDASGAQARYGREVTGTAIDIRGGIHRLAKSYNPPGLLEAHRLIECEHPLFFSIQGTAASKDLRTGEVIPSLIHQVAVTPQPRNLNCAAFVMAKSLSGFAQELLGAVPSDSGEKPLVWFGKSIDADGLGKALETTGIVPRDGTTGGDALKLEDAHPSVQNTAPCRHCQAKCSSQARYCPQCGAACDSASAGDYVRALGKAICRRSEVTLDSRRAHPLTSAEFLQRLFAQMDGAVR